MIMTEKRPSSHRSGALPAPRRHEDGPDEAQSAAQLSKTVMFAGHEDLYKAVLAVQERTKGSFSKACLALVEAGVRAGGAGAVDGAPDTVRVADLPAWLRSALYEAARLTGHSPAGVSVDIMTRNIRDYLEKARGLETEMAKILTNPPAPDRK
jgi:hypothetical protein